MRAKLVKIGNSQGIRIPKLLLKESGIEGEVNLVAKKGELKVVPVKKLRDVPEFGAASEAVFAKDWLRPEEEKAWKIYQSDT